MTESKAKKQAAAKEKLESVPPHLVERAKSTGSPLAVARLLEEAGEEE